MTVESIILFSLCFATINFIIFCVLCYKRIFVEKQISIIYVIIWAILTAFQLLSKLYCSKVYIAFSLIVLAYIIITLIVAYVLKKYLKRMFIHLINLSFNNTCISRIIIYRHTIITHIEAGYVIYDCTTEKFHLYKDLNGIVDKHYRKLALKFS